jgi:hypothetical protein
LSLLARMAGLIGWDYEGKDAFLAYKEGLYDN